MTHAVFIVHLLNTEILCVKHPSPLPLHTQSTFPPDDPTAWRRWRWQPASTSWTPGPPTSQPRGRGQKARPGEEAEPQGISWPFRSCLPLQPCVPTESRLPAFQWTKNRGHEREVRKGGRWKSIITELLLVRSLRRCSCVNWAQEWSSDCLVPTLSAPEHCQVSFHPCKFKGLRKKGHVLTSVAFCLCFPATAPHLQAVSYWCVSCHMKHSEWYSVVKHWCQLTRKEI